MSLKLCKQKHSARIENNITYCFINFVLWYFHSPLCCCYFHFEIIRLFLLCINASLVNSEPEQEQCLFSSRMPFCSVAITILSLGWKPSPHPLHSSSPPTPERRDWEGESLPSSPRIRNSKIFDRTKEGNGRMCEQHRGWFLRCLPSFLLKSSLQGTHLHRIYCWSQSPYQTTQWRGAERRRLQNQWKRTLVCKFKCFGNRCFEKKFWILFLNLFGLMRWEHW